MGQHILVCSAHIHWDPEFCDVKLIQTMMLMERLREITETCQDVRPDRHKKGSDNVHLLLCAGNYIIIKNSMMSKPTAPLDWKMRKKKILTCKNICC